MQIQTIAVPVKQQLQPQQQAKTSHTQNFGSINSEKTNNKPSFWRAVGAFIVGNIVFGTTSSFKNPINAGIVEKMQKEADLGVKETRQFNEAIEKTMKTSGLHEKGVSIVRATKANEKEVEKIMTKEMDKSLKLLPKKIRESLGAIFSAQVKEGNNAFFAPESNKIVLPENKLLVSSFHEMGHALNKTSSTIGKVLQKSRKLSMLASPIILIGLLRNKKAEGEKSETALGKTTDFIKKYAPALTLAAFAPTVIEEGLASAKGNKLAKQVLDTKSFQKVAKTNKLGFMTYAAMAGLTSLGTFLGIKARDSIAHKKD